MSTRNNKQIQVKSSKYEEDLEECKKQIEISMDYFNGSKQFPKRNALKPSSASEKLKNASIRSRNVTDNINFHSNLTGKVSKLSNKRISAAYSSNTNTAKNNSTYKRLSNNKFKSGKTMDNKENLSRNSNKNVLKQSRNSYGGRLAMQSNLSSTGAYNSITKQFKDDERPGTVSSYAPTRSNKNNSTRSKPIYQICETGASVEMFAKEFKGKDGSFSYNDMSSGSDIIEEVKKENSHLLDSRKFEVSTAMTSSKPKAFEYFGNNIDANKDDYNHTESVQSSISDSVVSEGSLVVQNLPTSKIHYATKKDIERRPIPNLTKSYRKNYIINNNKTEEKSKYEQQDVVYEVGSSSDSDEFDDSMEVEIELDYPIEEKKGFKLNDKYTSQFNRQATKAKSTKNKFANTQQIVYDFNKDEKKFKLDNKYNRKSEGQSSNFQKQKAREHKTINYRLRLAVEKGDINTIKKMIETDKESKYKLIDLNYQGQDQWTLLHIATNEGNYSIVKLLLENGANPNPQSVNQRTSLHIACMRGHLSIVTILLKHEANINIPDMDGNTPVHLWSEFGHHDLLRYLLTKRPTLYVLNKYEKSPVDVAANSEILHIFDTHLNAIKTELFSNIAEMNGLKMENTGSMAKRTKLVKVQDSFVEDEDQVINPEITIKEEKKNTKRPGHGLSPRSRGLAKANHRDQKNLILLHEQKFHPEMTKKYGFKEGKYRLNSQKSSMKSIHPNEDDSLEIIGPKSFVPIMILGKGSFGEVYLVQKQSSKEFFAMKILLKDKLMGQNLVKYARTERNVLSYTNHPFIVGLNFAFQTKEKLFLILDYCPGGDLGSVLTREKRFDEDRARIYLAEVLLALENLHKRDIIFRDLKPDNVVLDNEGHALLTDFGLSKEGVQDNK